MNSILQKVINCKMELAISGDFSKYESNVLKNFMCECNERNDIFFVDSEDSALKKMNMNSK